MYLSEDENRTRRGFGRIKETTVCSNHFDDYAIKDFIVTEGEIGTCSYCESENKIVELEFLVKFILQGIGHFYSDAGYEMNYETAEGGYYGASKYDTEELLNDEIGLIVHDEDLRLDIEHSIDPSITWCQEDPYALRENVELSYNWENFKKIVKHKSRYLFSQTTALNSPHEEKNPYEILHEVGRRVDALNLFATIPLGTNIFRCRQHSSAEIISTAKQMASPPLQNAIRSNRMSPAGISMFYGAFDSGTAYLETFDSNELENESDKMSTALFVNKEDLFLLDLSNLPDIPSIFDPERRKSYYSILFLKSFVTDLMQKVERDNIERIEYIPTQVVTEYFRYTFEDLSFNHLDGIIYPSAKNKGKSACVLFFDHEESLAKLNFESVETKSL